MLFKEVDTVPGPPFRSRLTKQSTIVRMDVPAPDEPEMPLGWRGILILTAVNVALWGVLIGAAAYALSMIGVR